MDTLPKARHPTEDEPFACAAGPGGPRMLEEICAVLSHIALPLDLNGQWAEFLEVRVCGEGGASGCACCCMHDMMKLALTWCVLAEMRGGSVLVGAWQVCVGCSARLPCPASTGTETVSLSCKGACSSVVKRMCVL